jgi:hypothetical protein
MNSLWTVEPLNCGNVKCLIIWGIMGSGISRIGRGPWGRGVSESDTILLSGFLITEGQFSGEFFRAFKLSVKWTTDHNSGLHIQHTCIYIHIARVCACVRVCVCVCVCVEPEQLSRYNYGRHRIRGSILRWRKRPFSSPQNPVLLCGPPSLLSTDPGYKREEREADLSTLPSA